MISERAEEIVNLTIGNIRAALENGPVVLSAKTIGADAIIGEAIRRLEEESSEVMVSRMLSRVIITRVYPVAQ